LILAEPHFGHVGIIYAALFQFQSSPPYPTPDGRSNDTPRHDKLTRYTLLFGGAMFPKVALSIEKLGAIYKIEIKDPPVKREFLNEASVTKYLASKFTMGLDEAREVLGWAENGRWTAIALPILPENIRTL
jgi:hypothetical protein